jgi:poly-beta-1,6-N-acetyl-D-glucosamine N-deacetylase
MGELGNGEAPWRREPASRADKHEVRLGTRMARAVTGVVFLSALVLAAVTWVTLSRPFDPSQRPALPVRLSPAAAREAALLPAYPGAVIALTYHGVSDRDRAGSTLTRRAFGEHMAALDAAGYRTVRLGDVEKLLAHEPVRLPRKALLITFDDGNLTDWTTADPVLKAHHFTAVAFLTTGKIVQAGTPSYYLSSRQVKALKATGRWEFGSHSDEQHTRVKVPGDLSAPLANRILIDGREESLGHWRSRIREDLAGTQRFFRRTLGSDVTAFSYPFGETGRGGNTPQIQGELPDLLREAGFAEAFAGENVPTDHVDAVTPKSPRYQLGRIGVRSTTSVADLLEMIRGAVPVAPPRDLSKLPWIGDLATCHRRSGNLVVRSDMYGTCLVSGVNTSQWTNYRFSTVIAGIGPHATAVIAVRDGGGTEHRGRVEVVIGVASIVVRQQIGDEDQKVLTRMPIAVFPGPRDLSLTVRGHRLVARVGLGAPLAVNFDPRLNEGGFKFEIAAQGRHTLAYRKPTLIQL